MPQPAASADGMATPEQKQQLMDLIDQIRQNLSKLHATQFASTNQAQQQRADLLKSIFAELQSAGVDLRDPKSVSDFLAKLRQQSPDMADLFEQALSQLLGGAPDENANQNPNEMMTPSEPIPGDMNSNGPTDLTQLGTTDPAQG